VSAKLDPVNYCCCYRSVWYDAVSVGEICCCEAGKAAVTMQVSRTDPSDHGRLGRNIAAALGLARNKNRLRTSVALPCRLPPGDQSDANITTDSIHCQHHLYVLLLPICSLRSN